MVAQIHQRRQHVIPQRRGLDRPALGCRRVVHPRQAVLQLEDDALGCLLADAGDSREPRDVAAVNRLDQFARLDTREHRQRELRADAADRDQAFEQLLLETRGKPEQQQRILAHVRVNAQRDVRACVAQSIERGERHRDVVADTVHLHDDPVRLFFEDAAAKVCDHERAGL